MTAKQFSIPLVALLMAAAPYTNGAPAAKEAVYVPYDTVPYVKASPEKMQWWRDAKFGLFIHWGIYAVPAGLWSTDSTYESWYKEFQNPSTYNTNNPALVNPDNYSERLLHKTQMKLSEYEKLPKLFDWSDFNAQDYIDLCFASGQRYICITSKHHDGFAMWRSDVTEWDIGDATPYGRESGRDPLKELAAACNATKTNGSPWEIKMCFYYSHCVDWYEDGAFPFDYKWQKDATPDRFEDYLNRKVKPQLTELLTEFGDVGMIWWDVPRFLNTEQAIELRELVNSLNPNTISDGRLGRDQGNYVNCGDNGDVGVPVDVPFETPSSINKSFGYHAMDHEHESPEWIVNKLIDVVSHGGNYLLNVGPKADGSIADEDHETLVQVGKWNKINGDAIFGTRRTPYIGDKSFMHEWGTCTQKDGTLYLIVRRWPESGKVAVPLLQNKIKKIYALADSKQKSLSYTRAKDENGNDTVLVDVSGVTPLMYATTFAVECEGDSIELAPAKHAYDPAAKQIRLAAANFQAHATSVKSMNMRYDRDAQAIVNWRQNKGRGATLAWTFEAPEAGEYALEIEYSAFRPHAGSTLDVLVNNRKQLSFVVERTEGYEDYQRRAIGTVTLERGKQDIALDVMQNELSRLYVMQLKNVYLTKQ